MVTAKEWLDRIRSLELPRTFKVMNVCGGHERSVSMAGLRTALPREQSDLEAEYPRTAAALGAWDDKWDQAVQ